MKFGEALEALREGKFVTRAAYHGTIFLFLRKTEQINHPVDDKLGKLPTQPAIVVKGHHGIVSSFCPTDADLLADDWAIVNT